MNRKLAACILAFVIGTTVTANASAYLCNGLNDTFKDMCIKNFCDKIPWDIAHKACV
ncbi:hypothetical protein Xhom_03604 [Xenorhabdus hominickii]|uniref:Uncharacterized protein n=1 Tax=Xenorhabdus hominickii TaxID=351679 RepID=A0A2G0Q330_XENHO|nr:hypothetical protein Xhom_03604 [Xenorhabdus hominickii]